MLQVRPPILYVTYTLKCNIHPSMYVGWGNNGLLLL